MIRGDNYNVFVLGLLLGAVIGCIASIVILAWAVAR